MDIEKIIKLLKENYKNPKIELNFSNPFELLIATILSAQARDTKVNEVTNTLFKELKTVDDYLKLGIESLEEKIKNINFYKNKAKNIIECCKILKEKYNGNIPEDIESLTKLPGIGRKTANVIIGVGFGKPAIIVDTHVKRVSKRLGLTKETSPEKIEFDLQKKIPEDYWTKFSLSLILHGRYICKAKNPKCKDCFLKDECEEYKIEKT